MAATTGAYAGASQAAIEHHYDVGDEFYALWLDETLTYSCALWEEGDSLEAAQARKLDYLLSQAGVRRGARILDVGCGWGSLLARLAERDPEASGVGLTLSRGQAQWCADRLPSRFRVDVRGWADYESNERFDGIISIGAFEHFARPGLKGDERVAGYRTFFERCHQLLTPGGRLALQTIVKGSNARLTRTVAREMRFICDFIFPQSELPWPSEVMRASERLLEPLRATSHADDYVRTGRVWLERLRARRDDAVELSSEDTVVAYETYLEAFGRHFESRHVNLMRFTFQRGVS